MTEKRHLINTEEAAKQLGLAVATLKDRRILGKPPSYLKVGRRVFYDQQVIQDYLTSCIRTSTKDNDDSENDSRG